MLWECIIEQLQTIPYENRWYELEDRERRNAVMRVHSVIMSQVMAVEHSMLELGTHRPLLLLVAYLLLSYYTACYDDDCTNITTSLCSFYSYFHLSLSFFLSFSFSFLHHPHHYTLIILIHYHYHYDYDYDRL